MLADVFDVLAGQMRHGFLQLGYRLGVAFDGPRVSVGQLGHGFLQLGYCLGVAFDGHGVLLHLGFEPEWFAGWPLHGVVTWLHGEGPNPTSCAAIGEGVGIVFTVVVSKLTAPLPAAHIERMFGAEETEASEERLAAG